MEFFDLHLHLPDQLLSGRGRKLRVQDGDLHGQWLGLHHQRRFLELDHLHLHLPDQLYLERDQMRLGLHQRRMEMRRLERLREREAIQALYLGV